MAREGGEMGTALKSGVLLSVLLTAALGVGCARDPEVAKREYVQSGDRFRQEKKVKEAIVQYRNALKQDPRFGEARFKLAEAYVEDGDWRRGGREYIRAADLLPKDVDAQLKAGRVLLFARQFQDAATRAHNALALDRHSVDAQILLGNALAGLRDVDGAIEEIQEAIKLDPNNALGYVSLGALEHAAGRRVDAEAAFRKAIDADPKSTAAYLGLANFYLADGRQADAANILKQSLAVAPDDFMTNRMMALFHIAAGRPAEAEPYLNKLASLSKDAETQLVLADYYLASNRKDKALPLLQKIAATPSRGEADLRLARLDLREGRREPARQRLAALLEREPGNAAALVLQAEILDADGKRDEALGRLQAAVSANPSLAEAQFALGRAYVVRNDRDRAMQAFTQTLRLNPRAVSAQVELSRLELSGGRADSSIQFAEQALKNAPRNPDAQLALVRALIASRNVRRAEIELQVLTQYFPEHAAVQTQAGILAGLKGDRVGADRLLTRALELDPNNIEALSALVSLDLAQKNNDAATGRVEARLARTPKDPAVLLLGAGAYARVGDSKRAEQLLRTTIEVDAENVQAYDLLGRLYLSQQRLDEALAEFDALSKRHPRPVQALTLAGVILEAQKKPEEARKRYQQALALDPDMAVAANNLAWMYVESGDNMDVALQLAQTATRRLPDNPAMQDTLGWIYYKKGLAMLAVPPFERSVKLDPRNPVFRYHLGLAYLKAGDSTRARAALQEALSLAPDFTGAADARQMLVSLKG
jgi:tetratricopeptide (TPR) repeat protein